MSGGNKFVSPTLDIWFLNYREAGEGKIESTMKLQ